MSRTRAVLDILTSFACLVESSELGSSESSKAVLLVRTEPRLLGVAEEATKQQVKENTNDDHNKGWWVQVVQGAVEDVNTNDSGPKVGSEEGDVEEGGTAHAEH